MGVGILGMMGIMDTARNASSNGGDASSVGIDKGRKYSPC